MFLILAYLQRRWYNMIARWLTLHKGGINMNIKRIYIDGFKNVDNVNVTLSKLTSLLSINNFGKSNYLKAVDFAMKFISSNQKDKVNRMNTKNHIPILNSNLGKNFKFEIEFSTDLKDEICEVIYGYEFQWGLSKEREAKIVKEYLKIKQIDSQKFSLFVDRENENALYKAFNTGRCDKDILIKENELLINKLSAYDNLYYIDVIKVLNEFEVYIDRHFDSEYLYSFNPLVEKGNNFLSPLSDNGVARILNELKNENLDKYNLIINTLKELFPYITEVGIHEIDLTGHNKSNIDDDAPFKWADVEYVLYVETKNISRKIQFSNMSDGVKRILSILTYITLADYNNIPLIAIEEPENSIHPGLLKKYLMALSNFAKNSKIIITSHSPYLINFMDLSNVYIGIPNSKGIATFRKIKNSAVSKINNHADDMDIMAGEYLFDLMSGYTKEDIESLKKYLENE